MTSPVVANRRELRVLLVEDSEDDARLILRELQRGGFAVTAQRVETREALASALADGEWNLVLSDYNLPNFSGSDALGIVQDRAPFLPFIIISGSIGEDLAVAAMKAGASDYVMKGQLTRLVPAVRREIIEAENRRQHAEAEQALRRTENQLRQAQKMEAIGRLAGGVAHDFNNLLTAILGYSEFLLDEMGDTQHRADLEEIRKAGERAATLTRQLLAFSRQQVLEPRVLDFNEVVTNLEKLLRRVIGEDIELMTALEPGIGRVKVDAGQMEQVLMNLVINARDAMPRGGRLSVRTSEKDVTERQPAQLSVVEPGRYLVVSVIDTGIGMTPELVKQIFEPFFTTKDSRMGTGLGLSTVYGIVEQSSGHICVESKPGWGTTFDIYLPIVDEPLDTRVPASSSRKSVEGSETVLLADDDDGIRELLERALTNAGYHVLTAVDGVDATVVAKAHRGPLHLLITDLVMPRMEGSELAAQLIAENPGLVVLYMSGYTDRAEWVRGPQSGRAYLQKPFTPGAILRRVRELLDARTAQLI